MINGFYKMWQFLLFRFRPFSFVQTLNYSVVHKSLRTKMCLAVRTLSLIFRGSNVKPCSQTVVHPYRTLETAFPGSFV